MSRNLNSEVLKFIADLPYWQGYLSAFVLGRIDADKGEVIEAAYKYVLAEHGVGEQVPLVDFSFPEPTADATQNVQGIKLVAIKGIHNVNALRAGQTLPIGATGVTAIGGMNGAGKSSIARLLNSVFYSRGDDEIIPNVFEASDSQLPGAVFIFQRPDGTEYELTYIADGKHNHPEFSQFASFDTKCVNIHLNQENELHVAPRGFQFFRDLAELTNLVLLRLNEAIEKVPTENPFTDQLDGASNFKQFVTKLGPNSAPNEIEQQLAFSQADEERIPLIEKEIEGLNVSTIEAKRKELTDTKKQLADLKTRFTLNAQKLSTESIQTLEAAFRQVEELKKNIQEKGAERFKASSIKGAGTDTWKLFLESGKKLGDIQHEHYPAVGDSCIFCSQVLDDKAITHINGYWEFLGSDSETRLKTVEEILRRKNVEITTIRLSFPDETSALARWLTINAPTEYEAIKEQLRGQRKIQETLVNALATQKWEAFVPTPPVSLDSLIDRVDKELVGIDTKALLEKKLELELEARNLSHKKKLSAKKTEILKWVSQRKWAEDTQKAKRGISTKGITETGKRLFDEHVTKKYKQMFHQECARLNARFRLEMTQTGRGGKSHRKYEIEGYPPGKILSEGEQRAVSLADFITELKISGINSGWVFDDPVNSQDIERKELIAKMLVEEAQHRQVIVFTHDITFLYDLNGSCAELGVPLRSHWVERQGLDAGIMHVDVPPNFEGAYINPDRAEKKLTEAKASNLDPMERENRLREGFSCLRASYETFVIQKMLAKTVMRFDRRLGYDSIERIYAPPEWKKRAARKLKKLSEYIEAHSQSDLGRKPLTAQLLEDEINEFKKMKIDFGAEQKAALDEEAKVTPLTQGQNGKSNSTLQAVPTEA